VGADFCSHESPINSLRSNKGYLCFIFLDIYYSLDKGVEM
jgi:hypothetical protein